MPKISFTEDFIGHNLGLTPDIGEHPSFFSRITSLATDKYPVFGLISEDGGSCCRCVTGNVINDYAGFALTGPTAQARRHPVFGGRLMFRNDLVITNQKTWFGFSKTLGPPLNVADDFHGFFVDNTASLGNWQWIHRSGGSEQSGDTGFVAQQEFWYEFQIVLTPKEAIYIVNSKLVQKIKRDASTLDLCWLVLTRTGATSEREMLLDLLYGEQDR